MEQDHTLDNGSVWHKDWPHKIYVGQWPIFCGPVILLYILKTVWWWNIIFRIMDQCETKTGLINRCGSVTYILWSSDFALCFEDYLMDEGHTWYGSVWHKDWPHKIYIGRWPIFHGPVILTYILKTFWWMMVIHVLWVLDQCDTKIDLIK